MDLTSQLCTYRGEIGSLILILLTVLHVTVIAEATPWPQEATTTTIRVQERVHVEEHVRVAKITCDGTLYPEQCISLLSSLPNLASRSVTEMMSIVLNQTVIEIDLCSCHVADVKKTHENLAGVEHQALDDCITLFEDTNSALREIISQFEENETGPKPYHNLQTVLSGAMTNVHTCLDSLGYHSGNNLADKFREKLTRVTGHVSNSLVMLKKVPESTKATNDEVFPEFGELQGGFPTWVTKRDRRFVVKDPKSMSYDCVVATDGTGKFKSVQAAINSAPDKSKKRFTIYIKAGKYKEQVKVSKKKMNLMLIGDGVGKTIITGSKNVVDGSTTFRSATFAVSGAGFIAKGITFENTAGPEKHQAVAVRNSADLSVFYKCSFHGFQDTLYTFSNRQFYRECDIFGTVDFIFGNAAAVFQKCNLRARKPGEKQNTLVYTAQGRKDPNQNTGISIIDCKVDATRDLAPIKGQYKVYLGRPWKQYSRTVYIKSYLGDLINPKGWLEWNGNFALNTLYYAEYQNNGPGSNTKDRVKWGGYHVITNQQEAAKFTVDQFIQGNTWLPPTGIPYSAGLS
nr:PREDICTED: pectinesterase-like [Bemisia tabaci]